MKEPSLEQPQESNKDVVSDSDLAFILKSFKGMPAEALVKRFIAAEETERNDLYAEKENAKLYLKEKMMCIEALQNMKQMGVADMLIKRLNG